MNWPTTIGSSSRSSQTAIATSRTKYNKVSVEQSSLASRQDGLHQTGVAIYIREGTLQLWIAILGTECLLL